MTKRFEELVKKHRDWVYTFAYYSLGNREEAEDTTQEVLMRLWDNMESLREESVSAWLRRVTTNACIDTARKRKAYRARVVAGGGAEQLPQAVSRELDPELTAEGSELRDHIRAAVSVLKEPYRSIVIHREIQGMRYDEISDILRLPLNTVKSYLHRARRMLREQLQEVLYQ
jgi:RNA polymerase sigma-70 factor (ECF subfamily)